MDYFFDKDFIFTRARDRIIDPLETKKAGETVYLKFRNSTTTPPPVLSDNQSAIYDKDSDSWTVVSDYRGKVAFSVIDQSDITIEDLGDLPENYTIEEPGSPFDVWDGLKWVFDTDKQELQEAKDFVSDELLIADINIKYHEDNDSRAVSNLGSWRKYRRDLRDYVKNDIITGDRPVRPV